MKAKWNETQLPGAVERYNAIADGMEKALPQVTALLEGAKVTANGVDKRTKDKINAILKATMPAETWARSYLNTQYNYTLYLFADFCAHNTEYSVSYAELTRPVAEKNGETWKAVRVSPPARVTVAQVQALIDAARNAEEVERQARSAACEAKCAALPFVD